MRTLEDHRTTALAPFTATTEGEQDCGTTKKWFLAVLSVVLLAAAAYVSLAVIRQQPTGARNLATPEPGRYPEVTLTRLAGPGQRFGPVFEATLPAARSDGHTELLDLETGRCLTRPGLDGFNENVAAMMTWIRTNRLNISCRIWPDGRAAWVTYNMTVVPVETTCWEATPADDIPDIPVPGQHSPSRLLVLGPGCTDTYAFRTDAGTLGLLHLVGLSDDARLVKIRYKLLLAGGDAHRDAIMRH
jgi:hypothetical protein